MIAEHKSYLGKDGFMLRESDGSIDSTLLYCTEKGQILEKCIQEAIKENILMSKSIYKDIFSVQKLEPIPSEWYTNWMIRGQ